MSMSPFERLKQTAMSNHPASLRCIPTVTLLDHNGEPSMDYLSGDALNTVVRQLYREVLLPINQERKRLLNAAQTHQDIVHAAVDPLTDALRSPQARLLRFCHQCMVTAGIQVPREMWWTGALHSTLSRIHAKSDPRIFKWRPNIVNKAMYVLVLEHLTAVQLPLNEIDYTNFYAEIYEIVDHMLKPDLLGNP